MFSAPPSPEMLRFLQGLRPAGLARSGRLKKDLEYLTVLHPTDLDVLLAQYPGDKVADYCTHIRKIVRHKPHVLVAYAWCFYMAVFSGGRWIRAQLVNAGDDFWRASNSSDNTEKNDQQTSLEEKGLSFWNFPGSLDGEDIKADFKTRLAAAESLFTDDERVDVIEEAKEIFRLSATIVDELDEKLATDMEKLNHIDRLEKKRAHEQPRKAEHVTLEKPRSAVMWFHRPEVTGAVVALGCLACVALFGADLSLRGDW
jgi:heme oxygenase